MPGVTARSARTSRRSSASPIRCCPSRSCGRACGATGFRTYLSTRGWYTTIGTLRDPRYPNHGDATEALREAIVREINANPDVRAMDLRHQARYRKWAYGFGTYVFNQEIYKDTAIYYSDPATGEPRGSRRFGAGRG